MHSSRWALALLLGIAAPLAAQQPLPLMPAQGSPDQLNLYVVPLKAASGVDQLAPALQRLLTDTATRTRLATRTGADTLHLDGRAVVVDSAFRAAVIAARGTTAAASMLSPSATFVRVVADTRTNSLLIRSSAADHAFIQQVVQSLDR